MVVKKAWVPACGTYSIGHSKEPFNPTVGDLHFAALPPKHIDPSIAPEKTVEYAEQLKDNDHLQALLVVASLANSAHVHRLENEWKARGDPTEIALQVFASRFGCDRATLTANETGTWKEITEFPFDSEVKKMSAIFSNSRTGVTHVFTKGAVEMVITSCTSIYERNGRATMTPMDQDRVLLNMEALASLGLRVLALASRTYDEPLDVSETLDRAKFESGLTFLGLVGIYDPPRAESAPAVSECHRAGIEVHMLTGKLSRLCLFSPSHG